MVSQSVSSEGLPSRRAQTLMDLGLTALRRGARGLARQRLARVVELTPASSEAWIALARVAASPVDAVAHLRRALVLAPESTVARAGLVWHTELLGEAVYDSLPETIPVQRSDVTGPLSLPSPEAVTEESQSSGATCVPTMTDAGTRIDEPTTLEEIHPEESVVEQPVVATDPTREEPTDLQTIPASLAVEVPEPAPVLLAPANGAASHSNASHSLASQDLSIHSETTEVIEADEAGLSAPPVSEQELATVEWQQWLKGRQGSESPPLSPTVPPPLKSTTAPAIVSEVSERLAHALQRVLGARAGLSLRTEPIHLLPSPQTQEPVLDSLLNATRNNPATLAPVASSNLFEETLDTSPEETLDTAPEETLDTVPEETLDTSPEVTFDTVPTEPLAGDVTDDRPVVLVVDDSPTIRRVVVDALRPQGYRVYEAADGIQGIREIATVRPDLILMDITMPRLDGYRLCRLVKGHANTRSIPVVMLSGKDGTFDRLRGRLAGCSDYISKPFSNADLLDKVARHLTAASAIVTR